MRQFREDVIAFLKQHAAYICAECLAARMSLPLRSITMITLGLQNVDWFEAADDLCSLCHHRTRVIRLKK